MLGNLSIEEIEKRVGFTFPDELKEFMQETHQAKVSIPIAPGKWHCFDIPFVLLCGDRATALKIAEYLKGKHSACRFEIAVVKD